MLRSVSKALSFLMRFLFVFVGLSFPRFFRSFSYSFVVYGSQKDKDEGWPRWLQRYLDKKQVALRKKHNNPKFQLLLPMSLMHIDGSWGIVLATFSSQETFSAKPFYAVQALQQARELCPNAEVIAGAGQFGSWLHQVDDFVPQQPYTTGQLGTLYTMYEATKQLTINHAKEPSETTLVVLGGAGHIGSRLTHILAKEYKLVIAMDPRFGDEVASEPGAKRPLESSNPNLLQKADLVIVLTPKGDDILPYVDFLQADSVIGFDSHPGPSTSTLKKLYEVTTSIYQIRMINERTSLRTIPRLQGYEPQDVVGCLLTALVYLMKKDISFVEYGDDNFSTQMDGFFSTARTLGFTPKLTPPTRAREILYGKNSCS